MLTIGAVFAALAVIIGAFGAHALKDKVSSNDLSIFEIGVRYQMYHSLGIILLGLITNFIPNNLISPVAYFMLAGIFIFSGSLYLIVLFDIRWLGILTPIGGVCFIIAWLLLAYNIYRF